MIGSESLGLEQNEPGPEAPGPPNPPRPEWTRLPSKDKLSINQKPIL